MWNSYQDTQHSYMSSVLAGYRYNHVPSNSSHGPTEVLELDRLSWVYVAHLENIWFCVGHTLLKGIPSCYLSPPWLHTPHACSSQTIVCEGNPRGWTSLWTSSENGGQPHFCSHSPKLRRMEEQEKQNTKLLLRDHPNIQFCCRHSTSCLFSARGIFKSAKGRLIYYWLFYTLTLLGQMLWISPKSKLSELPNYTSHHESEVFVLIGSRG